MYKLTAREAQKARYDIALKVKVKSSYHPGYVRPLELILRIGAAQTSSASASATLVDGAAQWER
jgi:hypothetical protein